MKQSTGNMLLLDPAVSTLNRGDEVISWSARHFLEPLLHDKFAVSVSTHLPLSKYLSYADGFDLAFVLGSNLLRGRMNSRFRQWDIKPWDAVRLPPVVLMGVGWWQYGDNMNAYTAWLYKRFLTADVCHSVRDDFTRSCLVDAGFKNVINTGCPSLWPLTPDHIARVRQGIGGRVVFTLTDYAKNPSLDQRLIASLESMYEEVFFWPQGSGDLNYFRSLMPSRTVHVLPSTLTAFDEVLGSSDVDYIGTRLHGGIRALQLGRPAVILAVDNRAEELRRDFGLPVLPLGAEERDVRRLLETGVSASFRLPWERIDEWLSQFGIDARARGLP